MELHSIILGNTIIFVAIGCILTHEVTATNFTFCAYHDDIILRGNGNEGEAVYIEEAAASLSMKMLDKSGEVQPDRKTIKCAVKKNKCYTLWQTDLTTNTDAILKQGCWDHSDPSYCDKKDCMNDRPQMRNNTKFCCCAGDMCNVNVTDIYEPSDDATFVPRPTPDPNYRRNTIIIAMSSVISVAIISAFSFLVYRLWISSHKPPPDSLSLVEAPPSPSYELDQLKIDSLIQKGRYGEIWKGKLGEKEVAVKIFNASQRSYFINERDVYSLPFMEHDNLLKFYGATERVLPDGATQYLVVLQLCPEGSLIDYLKHNTLDWLILCRMCHSIACGLAQLHTDFKKGDNVKPVVAHRDFNTRNILIRADLSCVICDLGFAMKLAGTRLYRGQDEEQVSLIDVGTLRYMAPEVLDGAVNLRDCESSLKQIDVYALGLVIWEIASRCSDLYQGMPVPEHSLPFQHELGAHPTLEEMQLMVSRKKVRPVFPDVWKDTHQAIRALKETIEDCWDQDAEARLTAMCVEERILEMTNLWEAVKHKGVTPTILQCGGLPDSTIMQRNITSQSAPPSQDETTTTDRNGNLAQTERSRMLPNVEEYNISSSYPTYHRFHNMNDHSVSTSTTETTLTMSPSEPEVYTKANRNIGYAKSNRANQSLQPHQGRNPTVERNTHKRSDEELQIKGNTLVEGGISQASSTQNMDHIFDSITDNLDSSLVQHDILNQNRTNNPPIPYVQNRVSAEPMVVRPKQANVPGNGQSHKHGSSQTKSRSKMKKLKEKGKFNLFVRNPIIRGFLGGYWKKDTGSDAVKQPLQATVPPPRVEPCYNPEKCNLLNEAEYKTVATKVCLMNGSPVVRPLDLQLRDNRNDDDATNINLLRSHEGRLGVAEVGVAKLRSVNNGHAAVVKLNSSSVGSSRSESASSESEEFENGLLQRRPSSLSLNGHNYTQNDLKSDGVVNSTQSTPTDVGNANNVSVEELKSGQQIKRRVKTPYMMRPGRFSLYDDRMMTDSCRETLGKAKTDYLTTKSSISLQQFNSGDIDISALKAADYTC
ncbi:bone morphogenetic protein receptor type-2-like isoform X2 [Lineus longissimus]|uniref:bone morphogenetic protein receptor type-2-like isoform X2 n=1 Tax=Lineus longissimus TaxID=88925 RepID=UPI00315DF75C